MFAFSKLSVKAGTKFMVVNKDNADHTFHVAGTKLDPVVKAGSSFEFYLEISRPSQIMALWNQVRSSGGICSYACFHSPASSISRNRLKDT